MKENENKGFLHTMFYGGGNIVEFNPSSFKLDDIGGILNKIREQDEDRRKILDKEYTPLEEIKLADLEAEISKYGDNIPKGLFVKVNWCGRYMDIPAISLLNFFREMHKGAKMMFDNQGENPERSVATDPK